MDLELKGKAAIVGGGSSGIGYAIAHRLAQEGARVLIWARRQDALDAAAERIREETGGEIAVVAADIHKPEDNLRVIGAAVERFGQLDILINNDGAPPIGALLEFDDAAWQKAIQQNLMSVIRACRAAVPHMRTAGGGRIINITAISTRQPATGFGLSVATWAGLIGYAKTLSLEVGPDHITVNTICPGRIDTPLSQRGIARAAKGDAGRAGEILDALILSTPVRRIGVPEDIAAAVTFLASSHASFITGVTLSIDGGRSAALM
ncbi:MAG TPA: glucose 1-dehydrogenase [Burkholderiales bacterium]|nr:glucose 1-dehydrogenase [Burkholderiales bacterium]